MKTLLIFQVLGCALIFSQTVYAEVEIPYNQKCLESGATSECKCPNGDSINPWLTQCKTKDNFFFIGNEIKLKLHKAYEWFEFYGVAAVDKITKIPQYIERNYLANNDTPEKVFNTVVKGLQKDSDEQWKRYVGNLETGHYGYVDNEMKELGRKGILVAGEEKKIGEDSYKLVPYAFDANINTCLKKETYSLAGKNGNSTVGAAEVQCYSEYFIYLKTGKSATTMPYFETAIKDCPNKNGKFINRYCSIVKLVATTPNKYSPGVPSYPSRSSR